MKIRKALLVDDSPSARRVFQSLLEEVGLEVALASSGEEALGYLEALVPDVVFMDHLMRGMSGLETALEIARRPATAGIPVIMLSSSLTPALAEEARRHGVWKTLPKRADRDMIRSVIDALRDDEGGKGAGNVVQEEPARASLPLVPAEYMLEEGEAARLAVDLGNVIQEACAPVVDCVLERLRAELSFRCLHALEAVRPQITETVQQMVREIVLEALAEQSLPPPVTQLRRLGEGEQRPDAGDLPRKASG